MSGLPAAEAEALLRRLVGAPSPTGGARLAVRLLVEEAQRLGLDAGEDRAGNFVARAPGRGPHVAFVGHVDTVPGDIPVRVEGRALWGRGAVDAKGPLVAALAAAANLAGRGDGPRLTVAATVDEEGASESVRALALDDPDAILVGEPSGWAGVTLGYKGTAKLHLEVSRDVAHGSRPEPTAAEAATELWSAVRGLVARRNPGASPFSSLTASLRSLATVGDGLRDAARLVVDLRVPVGFALDPLLADVGHAAREAGATWEVRGVEAPVRVEPGAPLVRALVAGIREEGGEPTYRLKAGTSDMAFLRERYAPPLGVCAYGPGDAALDHTPEERIDLDEFARGVRVVERALRRLAAAPAPGRRGSAPVRAPERA